MFALRYAFLGWHTLAGGSAILMPLLTGLFGISVLLTASRGTLPEQVFRGIRMEDRTVVKCSLLGTLAGIAVGWLPGLSTASANGVLASLIGYEKDRRAYILATNAANTANAFIGLAALFALSRMRNGVMVALSELPLPSMGELMVAGVLAACAAYLITIRLSRSAHRLGAVSTACAEPGGDPLCRHPLHRSHRAVRYRDPRPGNSARARALSRKPAEGLLHGCDHGARHTLFLRDRLACNPGCRWGGRSMVLYGCKPLIFYHAILLVRGCRWTGAARRSPETRSPVPAGCVPSTPTWSFRPPGLGVWHWPAVSAKTGMTTSHALREVCFAAAEQEIREQYAGKDAELLQMVQDA